MINKKILSALVFATAISSPVMIAANASTDMMKPDRNYQQFDKRGMPRNVNEEYSLSKPKAAPSITDHYAKLISDNAIDQSALRNTIVEIQDNPDLTSEQRSTLIGYAEQLNNKFGYMLEFKNYAHSFTEVIEGTDELNFIRNGWN